jgi:hypothetical protein
VQLGDEPSAGIRIMIKREAVSRDWINGVIPVDSHSHLWDLVQMNVGSENGHYDTLDDEWTGDIFTLNSTKDTFKFR